jgi:hypothetical protein
MAPQGERIVHVETKTDLMIAALAKVRDILRQRLAIEFERFVCMSLEATVFPANDVRGPRRLVSTRGVPWRSLEGEGP